MLEADVMDSTLSITCLRVGAREPGRSLPKVALKPSSSTFPWTAGPPVATRVCSPIHPTTGRWQFNLFYFAKIWSAQEEHA